MPLSSSNTSIGFVGIGVMGASMARHLMDAGYPVTVYNRTRTKAQPLLDVGATWAASVAELAAGVDVVITMVGFPADVEEVYFGPAGIIANAEAGTHIIDMTTTKPSLAVRIFQEATKRALHALDAPVTGGDVGAREAKLSIMVGGDEKAFKQVHPILACMGSTIVYQGRAGSGQHTKLANQIAIAGTIMGVCECLAYAREAGLDPARVMQSVGGGSASSRQLATLGPRMLANDFAPGFYVKHFIKDMGIALEEAEMMGLEAPMLALAKKQFDLLAAQGGAEQGTQALYKLYA
jgi:3-hydroxyisobutyrate dehydrogenase